MITQIITITVLIRIHVPLQILMIKHNKLHKKKHNLKKNKMETKYIIFLCFISKFPKLLNFSSKWQYFLYCFMFYVLYVLMFLECFLNVVNVQHKKDFPPQKKIHLIILIFIVLNSNFLKLSFYVLCCFTATYLMIYVIR